MDQNNNNSKVMIAAIAIGAVSLCLSIVSLLKGGTAGKTDFSDTSVQYVMYVGTNDKDTYQPEHTNEEARDIVDQVCLKYFDGYTLQEATGSWTDEKNRVTHEYTLVCYFDYADKEKVYAAADELREKLNQNTILIEQDQIRLDFYGGDDTQE